jgi:hypothetical protein
MSKHIAISPNEAADRLAIRELVEAYAHCADRRDAKAQMALFTADTHFVVQMNAKDLTPSQELHSREGPIRPARSGLSSWARLEWLVDTRFAMRSSAAPLDQRPRSDDAELCQRSIQTVMPGSRPAVSP